MNLRFVDLRKKSFPTQRALAAEMVKHIEGVSLEYMQRRVSLYEASGIKPSSKEMKALSEIFDLPLDQMQLYFSRVSGDVATLFNELRDRPSSTKSLICACFQAPLRAYGDQETNEAIVRALKSGVFLMFVFPFPLRLSSAEDTARPFGESLALEAFYRKVWAELLRRYSHLREQLGGEFRHQLAIYRQRTFATPSHIAVAPMASRYTLDVQKTGNKITQTLYAWTEGTDAQRMFPIGLVSRMETRDLLDAWLAFLGQPLVYWAKKEGFATSDADSGPVWERYEPEDIGDLASISDGPRA